MGVDVQSLQTLEPDVLSELLSTSEEFFKVTRATAPADVQALTSVRGCTLFIHDTAASCL
jgi:hypothetical protein